MTGRSLLQSGTLLSPPVGISGGGTQLRTVTANATLTVNDSIVLADASSGAFTISLPTAVGFTGSYYISALSQGPNVVKVAANSALAQTIIAPGQAAQASIELGSLLSQAPFGAVLLVSDGSNWRMLSSVNNAGAVVPYGPLAFRGNPGPDGTVYMSDDPDSQQVLYQSQSTSDGQQWVGLAAAPNFPVVIDIPVISGTLEVGQTLTGSTGTWQGTPAPTFAYQWLRSESPISGATSSTYIVQSADLGQPLTILVTASNTAGSANAESGPVTILSQGAGTIAQSVGLFTSSGGVSNGSLSFTGNVAPIATATLNTTLTAGTPITSLPATVGASSISAGTTLVLVWGGYAQAFVTTGTNNSGATSITIDSATPTFAFPSGTKLAATTSLPYLKFPATPPPQVTDVPGIRFIIHNWALATPMQPWLLNTDGSLFGGTGGYLCRLEPGARFVLGATGFGAINQVVPGTPTASMRVAFQTLTTTEATAFTVYSAAWMV